MKYLPLIWAGLSHRPARSILTLLSVVIAFILFGMLEGINAGYSAVIAAQHLDRLLTDPKIPGGAPMPIAGLQKIESLPSVTLVVGRAVFFGHYQQPKNRLFALATDPSRWFAMRPEYQMPSEQLAALENTRAGIAITPGLRAAFQLELGDRIPLRSPILRKDGNPVWTFELVGIFEDPADPGQATFALINYDYFDEARATDNGTVDRFIVRIADPSRSARTAAAIDALFANSAHETRTQNEKEQTESQFQQLGDIGFLVNAIVAAVFFTLLFVTGNTMVQSVRERVAEFAVLKTIGFSDRGVFAIVLVEAVLLCVGAAIVGLAIAALLFPSLREVIGLARLSWIVVFAGMAAALLVALVSASVPAWRVKRLRIVAALATH